MKSLPSPPARLTLPAGSALRLDGQWRGWDSGSPDCKSFRQDFRSWALASQGNRCAYCRLVISDGARRNSSIDHFARKAARQGEVAFPQWTYEPLNLFLSCGSCNSGFKKNYLSVALPPNVVYSSCTFTMFHPYLDDARDHLVGGYPGGTTRPNLISSISTKGAESIRVFGLDDSELYATWLGEYREAKRVQMQARLSAAGRALLSAMRNEVLR